ncbi:MAG: hypothetical protein Q4A48_01785 [Bacillota bacterium]|nr:hypothetical protein [Bacillota bacterium]
MTSVKQRISRLVIALMTAILAVGMIAAVPADVHAQGVDYYGAKTLALNTPEEGTIKGADNACYSFKTTRVPGMNYRVVVWSDGPDNAATGLWAEIRKGQNYDYDRITHFLVSGTETELFDDLRLGNTHYIVLEGNSAQNTYDYRVEVKTIKKRANIIKCVAGKKKITVDYRKMNGAQRYQIQCKRVGKKWGTSAVKTINTSKLRTTITKRLSGKKYNIRVRAQHRNANGKWVNVPSSKWSKVKTVKVK